MPTELFTIKPLEWAQVANHWWLAQAIGTLRYSVGLRGDQWRWWSSELRETHICASPEEGKRLAEEHWQNYIKQALVPVGENHAD